MQLAIELINIHGGVVNSKVKKKKKPSKIPIFNHLKNWRIVFTSNKSSHIFDIKNYLLAKTTMRLSGVYPEAIFKTWVKQWV